MAKKTILKDIITGNWLGKEIKAKNIYYILFVTFLIILLIYNRYRAEELILKKKDLRENVEILHSKYTKIQTKLMVFGTERKVATDSTLIKAGLKLPDKPPKIIEIKN
jgi:hypothetical protein